MLPGRSLNHEPWGMSPGPRIKIFQAFPFGSVVTGSTIHSQSTVHFHHAPMPSELMATSHGIAGRSIEASSVEGRLLATHHLSLATNYR